ncbi:MAG: hypothetical protein AAF092_15410 [Pseudomonadota bacterium]
MPTAKQTAKAVLQKLGIFEEVRLLANKTGIHKTVPHGHQVLIDEIEALVAAGQDLKGKTCIEIGSTREDVPGQGSTARLAKLCKREGIQFISVDMDPEQVERASQTIAKHSPDFKAHQAKGEEFLEAFEGPYHFLYLDAFDIDHAEHSERRRSRYKEILGTDIGNEACYEMHLRCAQAATKSMPAGGVVSFDDTWRADGRWQGKGYTALPFFEQNGFSITRETGNTVLLVREAAH